MDLPGSDGITQAGKGGVHLRAGVEPETLDAVDLQCGNRARARQAERTFDDMVDAPATQAISQAGELARPGIRGVAPGRAMPIPYTSSFGTCHVVSELPFR